MDAIDITLSDIRTLVEEKGDEFGVEPKDIQGFNEVDVEEIKSLLAEEILVSHIKYPFDNTDLPFVGTLPHAIQLYVGGLKETSDEVEHFINGD